MAEVTWSSHFCHVTHYDIDLIITGHFCLVCVAKTLHVKLNSELSVCTATTAAMRQPLVLVLTPQDDRLM